MSEAASTIRRARREAGLTQGELAARLHTSQAAIARLERPGVNPTVTTLRKTLAATGQALELRTVPRRSSVDLPQLIRHLRLTPAERLAAHQVGYDNLRKLMSSVERGE